MHHSKEVHEKEVTFGDDVKNLSNISLPNIRLSGVPK